MAARLRVRLLGVLLALTLAACAPNTPAGGGEEETSLPSSASFPRPATTAPPAPASQATLGGSGSAPPAPPAAAPTTSTTPVSLVAPRLDVSMDPAPPPTTPPAILEIPDPPQAAVPRGFAAVSAGWGYTCGLHNGGAAECWRWGENGTEHSKDYYPPITTPYDFFNFEGEKQVLELTWDHSPQASQPPKGIFTTISAGRDSACGLRPGGLIECWGNNKALTNPPEGNFAAINAGIEHACALRPNGQTECWGTSTTRGNEATPPKGKYIDLTTGDIFACSLRQQDSTAECWGTGFTEDYGSFGRGVIPPGAFANIDAGGGDVCGQRENGSIECWANLSPDYDPYPAIPDYHPYLTPPKGEFTTFNVTDGIGCGMRPSGEHECWGINGRIFPIPPGDYLTVQRGGFASGCGSLRGGGVECWNMTDWTVGDELPETRRINESLFVKLAVSDSHICGLSPSGSVECWSGRDDHPVVETPGGVFVDITSGQDYACGLRPDWTVTCWGSEYYGRATPPAGAFSKVSASDYYACGLRLSGEIQCWGEVFSQSKILPPTEPLTSVSAGWGGYRFLYGTMLSTPPNNTRYLADIAHDWGYTCGLRPDRTVRCWGDPGEEVVRHQPYWPEILDPPKREFLEIETGRLHACGLRVDGKIECWGNGLSTNYDYTRAGVYPDELRTSGPQTYTALSVGGTYTCGLRSDGAIECWDDEGTAFFQQTGPFTAVSAGYDHQCGLHTTGNIHCWEITPDDATPWKTQTYTPTPQ